VQQDLLQANPDANLQVYAIWTERLATDDRARWDGADLLDPRVTHLWDVHDLAGPWLAGNVPGYDGGDWDFYLLFGREARWDQVPEPLAGSGATVIDERDTLIQAATALLRED
jgi:hypothetical protein